MVVFEPMSMELNCILQFALVYLPLVLFQHERATNATGAGQGTCEASKQLNKTSSASRFIGSPGSSQPTKRRESNRTTRHRLIVLLPYKD
jgi:hypothetical protein